MWGLIAIAVCIWVAASLASGDGGFLSRRPDSDAPLGISRTGWLALGSLVFFALMARLGLPFFFLFLPPVFLWFSGRSED